MKRAYSFVALAGLLMLVGCDAKTTNSTGPTVTTEPTTTEVVRKDLVGYVFFDGKVVAPSGVSATVNSPYDIAVGEVLTTVGKQVNKGETIIKLSVPDLTAAVRQSEASVKAAESAYAAARSAHNTNVRDAQQRLAQAQADERAARLDIQNGGSADLQAATDARVFAERDLSQAQAELNVAVLGEKQALDMAIEYRKDARAGVNVAAVRAPIKGTVISLDAKPGLRATSGQQLAMITDLQALRIQGVVPPQHADLVKVGVKLIIGLEGTNEEPLEGEVTDVKVMPPSEGQTSEGYLASIRFDNSKGLVMPNSVIKRLGVRTGKVDQALVVPIGAISQDADGRNIIHVRRGNEWVTTLVEVGLSDGALTEIKEGLSEGDIVRVNAVVIRP